MSGLLRANCVIVGDATVGKTALIATLNNAFPKNYVMTSNCEFSQQSFPTDDGAYTVEFQIYDLSGQSIFRATTMQLFKKADFVVYCYDCSSRSSFVSLPDWQEGISQVYEPQGGVVVACKADLEERIQVQPSEGQTLAAQWGLDLFVTSSLRGEGMEQPFKSLAEQVVRGYHDRLEYIRNLS